MIFLAVAAVAGAVLSAFFFGGLWLTVRDIEEHERPAAWMITSFVARTAVVLGAFYLLGQAGWEAMGVAAATFVATRFVITRILGPSNASSAPDAADAGGSSWS